MKQILEALKYCHSKNIVHGDLRPHHLLLANRENSAPLKISGFGSAAELDEMGNVSEGNLHVLALAQLAVLYSCHKSAEFSKGLLRKTFLDYTSRMFSSFDGH